MTGITVLFATHNGACVLRDTLDGYCRLQNGETRWQLIIVNNASTDDTTAILDDYATRLPLTILNHAEAGKNKALNAALPHIQGNFVIVTDDDAIPQDGFLNHWQMVATAHADYDIFGGTIHPAFREAPPVWMSESCFHFAEIFATRDLPDGLIKATEIFGPNMAVRKRVFDSGLTFNEDIGPNGSNKNYPMGSETEFCRRVEQAGFKAYFAAAPTVLHIVRPHQIKTEFWISRAYKHGLGFGMQYRLAHSSPTGLRKYLSTIKYPIKQSVLWLQSRLTQDDLQRHQAVWQYHWNRGFYNKDAA